jgi:hypothetical protein
MLLSHNTCEDRGYRICIESYWKVGKGGWEVNS